MENITIEQIITVSVLCIWFTFPMGMLISFMRQSNEQVYPKNNLILKKKNHQNIDKANVDDDHSDYKGIKIPSIPDYQIPNKRETVDQWKT